MALNLQFLGGLPEGLLSAEQQTAAEDRARQAAALQLGLGMIAGSQGQRGAGKPGLARIIAQAGPGAMQAYQGSFDQTLKNMLTSMQLSEFKRRQEEQNRLQEATQQYQQRLQDVSGGVVTPSMAMMRGGGPTQAAAEQIGQPLDVASEQRRAAMQYLAAASPQTLAAEALKAPELPKYLSVEGTVFRVTPQGLIKEAEVPKAPLVQINEGQKGLENEMKIRSAFAGEPVYKAYQEVRSAYGQINDALRQSSPAGDLAAATKFMKLLDPGSVVRESELYMAMQASGALDRLTNYANMRISGETLTPEQRKDFQSLSDKLYSTAVESYNQKYQEYSQFAQDYGLSPSRAVGSPAIVPERTQKGAAAATEKPPIPTIRQMMETSKAPSGVRQELWNVMTPEQRKLWQ